MWMQARPTSVGFFVNVCLTINNLTPAMQEEPQEIQQAREIVRDILQVLGDHGIDTVHVGGILRILGVPNEIAAAHDQEYLVIQDELDSDIDLQAEIPAGTTLH